MSDLPDAVLGLWLHSHEEDTASARVYRSADYAFPPARGRDAVEFRANGAYVEYSSGPDDRGLAVEGRWRQVGGGRVEVTVTGAEGISVTRLVSTSGGGKLLIDR